MTFLRNIGADLVEKRLWPVAVALLVALVAVPVLLASPAKEPTDDGVSPAVVASAAKTEQAVTLNTKPVGRRVRGGSSKNPFKQLFVVKPDTAIGASVPTGIGTAGTTGSDTNPSGGDVNNGSNPAPKSSKPKSQPKVSSTVYRATLRFGEPGAQKTIADIPRLTPLPSIEDPFFVFLGVKEDGKTLVFLISSDTTAEGDGTCSPSDTCETLEMQAGDTETFTLKTDSGDKKYQMDVVKISKAKASSAKAASAARARHSKAGAALLTLAREDSTAPEMLGRYRWNSKRGVLEVVARKARSSKVAVGPIAGTSAVTTAVPAATGTGLPDAAALPAIP
jgi:hypothetical protein